MRKIISLFFLYLLVKLLERQIGRGTDWNQINREENNILLDILPARKNSSGICSRRNLLRLLLWAASFVTSDQVRPRDTQVMRDTIEGNKYSAGRFCTLCDAELCIIRWASVCVLTSCRGRGTSDIRGAMKYNQMSEGQWNIWIRCQRGNKIRSLSSSYLIKCLHLLSGGRRRAGGAFLLGFGFGSFFWIFLLNFGLWSLQVFEIPPASNLLSVMGCHIDSCWVLIFYSVFTKIAFPIQHVLE